MMIKIDAGHTGCAPAERSARPEVRNPLLQLPAAGRMAGLPEEVRAELAELMRDLSLDARARAQNSWRSHKAPMAAYWKMVSVYARHVSVLLRRGQPR